MKDAEKQNIREHLEGKIKFLNDATWENRITAKVVKAWLSQFQSSEEIEDDEQIHALFLLSHFLYFGQPELRALLKSLYRDMVRSPTLQAIRRANGDTTDAAFIRTEFESRRKRMRFLAVGNPSESGMHLLYYFRQENVLPKDMFINTHEIFERTISGSSVSLSLRNPSIDNYIFIDDLCGSGTQASDYSIDIVSPLKALAPTAKVSYLVLFATTKGLGAIRALGCFDKVGAVFELDETFRSLETESRIFSGEEGPFDRIKIRNTCQNHGVNLFPSDPLGYKDGQLLIGFNHNTPDNTLPIFWGGDQCMTGPWKPVFKRYDKVYGS